MNNTASVEALAGINTDRVARVFPAWLENVTKLERIQNHVYSNKTIALAALFHGSAVVHWPGDKTGIQSNEKLEFLGDSFLNFYIARELISHFPKFDEGQLSQLRARLVGTDTLVEYAVSLGLGTCLFLGKAEANAVKSGAHGLLADAFEAVTAALLLDGGIEVAEKWLSTIFVAGITSSGDEFGNLDPKSRFQEWVQRYVTLTPDYRVVCQSTDKSGSGIVFEMGGFIGETEIARASGKNKKEASRAVAKKMQEMVTSGSLTSELLIQYAGSRFEK